MTRNARAAMMIALCGALASCGSGGMFNSKRTNGAAAQQEKITAMRSAPRESTLMDIFANTADPNTTLEVNKYLWQASLEVLDFLPIQSVDPFSGVIVTGYGTPPGGGGSYRATIYVQDTALDARGLKVSLQTRGGPASAETVKAVEDAILTRARQIRIRDKNL